MKMTLQLAVHVVSWLLCSLLLSEPGSCQTLNDTNTLRSQLLQNYDKNTRPVDDQTSAVTVAISFRLINILEFDEISETLSSVGTPVISWTDSSLVWNPADYNGTSQVIMSYSQIWVPEIVVINPTDGLNSMGAAWQSLRVAQNGVVMWGPGSIFKTSCPIDVTKYPFDTQICPIEVYTWGFIDSEIIMQTLSDTVSLDFYHENGVWALDKTSVTRNELTGIGNSVVFNLYLRRKPTFIIVNVVIPILALSLLNVLVFVLPVDAGERVSFSITVLLSIAVFMTIVSTELPKTSEPLAVLVYVLMMEMSFSGLISLLTVLNLRVYYKDESCPIPGILKAITLRFKGENRCRVSPTSQERDAVDQNVQELTVKKHQFEPGLPSDDDDEAVTWKDVSEMIDKLCFVGFLFSTMLLYVVFFGTVLTES